jgi:DNA-binding PadR family transcriptional regulator
MRENKRPLSNPLALAVLALLYEGPMHPYEMASTLKERSKESSIRLNYGSLYTIIEQLLREKFIAVKETIREGKRPEKTIYEITTEGRTETTVWMRELLSNPVKEYPQYEAALSLLPLLPPDEVEKFLEIRLGLLKNTLDKIKEGFRMCEEIKLPRLFSIEGEYFEAITLAEYKFTENLLSDIRDDVGGLSSNWKKLRKTLMKNVKGSL